MKLQEAFIRNFRSIRECKVKFPPDFLGLVGENDAGKSNIIDALDFFFHKPQRIGAEELTEMMFMHTPATIEVTCVFSSLTESDRTNLQRYVLGNRIVVRRTATLENERSVIKCSGAVTGNRFEDFQWSPTEFEGFRDTNQRNIPEFLHVPAIRDISQETSKKGDRFGDIISRIIQSIPDTDLGEIRVMQERANQLLNYDGTGEDRRHPSIRGLETEMSDLLAMYRPGLKTRLAFPVQNLRDAGVPEIVMDDGVQGLPNSKGHGMQSILFFTIFRLYEKHLINSQREDRRPLIFAIEEPEIYLHPTLQRTMFKTLQDISRIDQILISTHSPNFVDMMNYETIAKVTRTTNGTQVKQPPQDLLRLGPAERLRIFSRFNPTRNEMFFSKKTILVEGDSDRYAILCTATFCDMNLDSKDIVVIETNGKAHIPYYVKIADAFGIPFGVVYDSDTGEPQSEEQSREIEETISSSENFVTKLVFDPRLETELGFDHHLTGIQVLQHFEAMNREDTPANIRSFVETMCGSISAPVSRLVSTQ